MNWPYSKAPLDYYLITLFNYLMTLFNDNSLGFLETITANNTDPVYHVDRDLK